MHLVSRSRTLKEARDGYSNDVFRYNENYSRAPCYLETLANDDQTLSVRSFDYTEENTPCILAVVAFRSTWYG